MKYLALILAAMVLNCGFAADVDYPENLSPTETVEVLWSEFLADELDPVRFFTSTSHIKKNELKKRDELRLAQMRNEFLGNQKSVIYFDSLSNELALRIAAEQTLYQNIQIRLGERALAAVKKAKARIERANQFRSKSKEEIEDLVFEGPDLVDYDGGKYENGIKMFLFCRHDRNYPCRFVMKNIFDRLVRNKDESLWTMPALAKSAGNLPYYTTNGQTPSGVHSIDSVMPEANRQLAFGKFRRVILNWVNNDADMVKLLPESAVYREWWKEASLARDNGRKWLRIHGTGRINKKPGSPYYPHMPTAGCISVKEGTYNGIVYKDQRKVLDTMMEAMEMAPVFANETKIKGMLYVIELDDKKASVTEETLKEYGIY